VNRLGFVVYFVLAPLVAFVFIHYIYQIMLDVSGIDIDINIIVPLWLQIVLSFPLGYAAVYVSDYRNTCPYHTAGLIKSSGWDGEIR
jgi:hypothetical protein